jgi:hypothetical protein
LPGLFSTGLNRSRLINQQLAHQGKGNRRAKAFQKGSSGKFAVTLKGHELFLPWLM